MKKALLTVFLACSAFFAVKAQTNVSGGIYANTTWTLAGSPYTVTGNVVVFPGFTLTIEPGVMVKFDAGVQLEIRQAGLIAMGTNADSISFTSNTSLTAGSWNSIYLNGGAMTSKFNYCNFRYATNGIEDNRGGVGDSLIINNSNFNFNNTGLVGQGTGVGLIDNCNFTNNGTGGSLIYGSTINNCNFSFNGTGFNCHSYDILNYCTFNHNQTGMGSLLNSKVNHCIVNYNQTGIGIVNSGGNRIKNTTVDSNAVIGIDLYGNNDSIYNCQIKYNGIGLRHLQSSLSWPNVIANNTIENNGIGIILQVTIDNIHCNKICNNTTYDLQYSGGQNVSVANNYWCTADSNSTQAVIYDGHNNISYGLVNFMPMDTVQCYLATGISNYESPNFSFSIFPNPATDQLTLTFPTIISKTTISIFNMLGGLVYHTSETGINIVINVSDFASGMYVIQIASGEKIIRQKFIKQ